jgi:hypothetical protein
MATTKNIYQDPFNSDGEEKLLLDELISISNNIEHMSISHDDMLIYVHEKARCCNICEKGAGAKPNYKKRLRQN